MLKIENIQAGYGNIIAIKNVSLEINEGEIITLIGANGAGKSTTLMTISGVVTARSGNIYFKNEPIEKKSSDGHCKTWYLSGAGGGDISFLN